MELISNGECSNTATSHDLILNWKALRRHSTDTRRDDLA